MFAGVEHIKRARQELKHETELLSKNGFHCHAEKTLNASATVLYALRARGFARSTSCNIHYCQFTQSRVLFQDPHVKHALAYVNFLQSIQPVSRLD